MLGSIFALIYAAGTSVVIRCRPSLADIAATVNIAAVDTVGELTYSASTLPVKGSIQLVLIFKNSFDGSILCFNL